MCGQVHTLPAGTTLTSVGKRLGQFLLDWLLATVTLFIGWIIWSIIIWDQGQTPAMQLLHIRAVKVDTKRTASWGTMFVREFLAGGLLMWFVFLIFFPAWVVLCCMLLWDKDRQQLWDKIAGTIVVDDPEVPPGVGAYPSNF
jgi:uncharacterized RDD family membrane protein YckC